MQIQHLSLFKRSNGIWYICYAYDEKQRWKSTGTKNKQQALVTLSEFKESDIRVCAQMLFSEFINRYVTLHRHAIRESTYRRVCRSSFNREIAERVVDQNPNLTRVSERSEANSVVKLRIPLLRLDLDGGTISLFKNPNC
jgi:hypothetical protein